MKKIWVHYKGTIEHKIWVLIYCSQFSLKLFYRALIHDLSKFSLFESKGFIKYSYLLKEVEYNSDEYKELLLKLRDILKHHYANNQHHPEHWENGIDDMSMMDFVEMYCDWKAAIKRNKNGCLETSITHNKDRFNLSDSFVNLLRSGF